MSELMPAEKPAKGPKLPIYRRTYSRLWKAMRGLSLAEKNIANYLLTGDQTNRVGFFDFSPGKAAEDIEIPPGEFQEGFQKVQSWFGWRYDAEARVFFIPSWWRWNQPEGPKQLIGCLKDLQEVAPSVLLGEFIANVEYLADTLHPTYYEMLTKMKLIPIGKGMVKGSAFQEQEQEQDIPPLTPPSGGQNGGGDFFAEWFEAYPENRRKDRLKAEKVWGRLKRQGRLPPLGEMKAVLERQKRSDEWVREEGRYVPLPWRYLKLGRYVDASVAPEREPHTAAVEVTLQNAHKFADPGCGECGGKGKMPDRFMLRNKEVEGQKVCECTNRGRGP